MTAKATFAKNVELYCPWPSGWANYAAPHHCAYLNGRLYRRVWSVESGLSYDRYGSFPVPPVQAREVIELVELVRAT